MQRSDECITPIGASPYAFRWPRTLRNCLAGITIALCLASCTAEPNAVRSRASASTATATAPAPSFDQTLASRPANPPFYRIDGGKGASLLLLGTIHLGPETGWIFSQALKDGLERADSFVLEIDLSKINEDAVASSLARLVVIESPRTLEDLVSPETAKVLADNDALLTQLGLPFNARKRLKPWYIAVGLVESTTKRSGLSAQASAETVIVSAIDDRPVLGLETFEEQLAMLNEINPKLQDMMLRDTIDSLDEAIEETRALATAWHSGDEAYLENLAREGVDEMPEFEEFYEIILGARNRRWIPKLRSFLDDPTLRGEIVFVGVGALHLLKEDGLLELFRRAGYRVATIEHDTGIE